MGLLYTKGSARGGDQVGSWEAFNGSEVTHVVGA